MTIATAPGLTIESLRGWMRGQDCVVVGCGGSARFGAVFDAISFFNTRWTVACNRAVQFIRADFVCCVEPWRDKDLWRIVREESNPFIVFTNQAAENPERGRFVHTRAVKIDTQNVLRWLTPDVDGELRLGQSPWYATAVAAYLGFETVGLIGVDFDDERRWPQVNRENTKWRELADACATLGTRVIQLNPRSRLTSIERGTWEEVRTK